MNYKQLEQHLLGTRKTLSKACKELGIDVDDVDEYNLSVGMCISCLTWHKESNIIVDEYSDLFCRYCDSHVNS